MTSDSSPRFPSGDSVRDEHTLDRYFAGECTLGERAAIDAWLEVDPQRRIRATANRHFARYPTATFLIPEPDTLWSAFQARIDMASPVLDFNTRTEAEVRLARARGGRKPLFASPSRRIGKGVRMWMAAASVLVVWGLTVVAGKQLSWQRSSAPRQLADGRQYVAPAGQLMTVRLRDGSTVVLAPSTTLRTKPGFGTEVRDVLLDGEAYFAVTHDIHMPFRVQTAQGFVEDIGTKFAVRAYAGDTARIVVSEGKVAVGAGVVLGAGDIARVAAGMPSHIQRGVLVQHLLSWTTGTLEFQSTPLRDVVTDISRWYGVKIRVDDPALARHMVTATFRDMSAAAVLDYLARVSGTHIETRGAARVLVPTATSVTAVP